jgi:hypothetical protein
MSDDAGQTNVCESEFPRRKPGQSIYEYLEEVSNLTAPRMKDGFSCEEIMDELYDTETGLPQ